MNLREQNSLREAGSMDCLQRIICVMLSGKTDSLKTRNICTQYRRMWYRYIYMLCFYDFLCLFNNTSCVFIEKIFAPTPSTGRRKRRSPLCAVRDCEPLLEWLKAVELLVAS